jgi:hypothetical protein
MRQADKIKIQHPWCNIVTTRGQSPFMLAANDGVVTIASQRHHEDMDLIDVPYNHYEVVLADPVVAIIKDKISDVENIESVYRGN